MYWHLVRIHVLFDCLQKILAIEHDSICIADVDDACPEPSHTVMRLRERNDKKAHLIAKQHGLEIRVSYCQNLLADYLFQLILIFDMKLELEVC